MRINYLSAIELVVAGFMVCAGWALIGYPNSHRPSSAQAIAPVSLSGTPGTPVLVQAESSLPEQPAAQEAMTASPADALPPPTEAGAAVYVSTKVVPQAKKSPAVKNSTRVPAPTQRSKPPLQDPTARYAMIFVGEDPEAEAYWLNAIFDPNLPNSEREDLMEDLNEEGLSDHQRPSPEDFPLIMNRLALIEEIAPDADDFMLPHLAEAYKDLVNLAAITQGAGRPVP